MGSEPDFLVKDGVEKYSINDCAALAWGAVAEFEPLGEGQVAASRFAKITMERENRCCGESLFNMFSASDDSLQWTAWDGGQLSC